MKVQDRLTEREGTYYFPGMQALVRLPLEQARRDRERGLRIGTYISGYPGSPLGGYDLALQRASAELAEYGILHVPGANEELAATSLTGTQMLEEYPHSRYDGVTALWYGKGPGIDRSGDALKHGNFAGTSTHGSVVVLDGADHEAKSSTMPYQDDYAFMSAGIPVLYPATVQEFLTLGLHAIELSRYSGCWSSMKLHTTLCDGGETFAVDDLPRITTPELEIDGQPYRKRTDFMFYPGLTLEIERHLWYERHRAVLAYARANDLNRIVRRREHDRIGLVTAGKSYVELRQALDDLGLDEAALDRAGVRLLRMGMTYPVDGDLVREFAEGLEEVVVVEEKRGFLEGQVKEALVGTGHVRVTGKADDRGEPLFPIQGSMDSDEIARGLVRRLAPYVDEPASLHERVDRVEQILARAPEQHLPRTPNYCSGCPHNLSTRLADGQLAWGSPGCHAFASIMEQPERHIETMTQLGGEGLPWIGLAPFTDREHIVQNVGDGSLFHSAYLNIKFAVAADVNITFKVLFNGYIANTGAQVSPNGRTIPELTRALEADRIKRVVVLTKEPDRYADEWLGNNTEVRPAHELMAVSKELEEAGGVTVMIYDESCANERQRQQRRGKLERPNTFVVINEDVCENCGHCGELTNCMSLQKVDTEFGPKTQVHTSTCAQDYFCLQGDCPSFVTVETAEGTAYAQPRPPELSPDELPAPASTPTLDGGVFTLYLTGLGGTGVITLNAMLSFAALMEGRHVLTYDQTGAAQKWGSVISSLTFADDDRPRSYKVGVGDADLYLALDVVGGASPTNLSRCAPDRTVAVVNQGVFPTGEMTRNVDVAPDVDGMRASIDRWTRAQENVYVDGRHIAEELFADHLLTNIVMIGAAYQAGHIPLSAESIEAAIELNGARVGDNLLAFRYGRLAVADPDRVAALIDPPPKSADEREAEEAATFAPWQRRTYRRLVARAGDLDEETRRLVAVRTAELLRYQDADYAAAYVDSVLAVADVERSRVGDTAAVTPAYARNLYKLMAYKDEYEVARLHLKRRFQEQARGLFDEPRKLTYHLHPPVLRRLGYQRKIAAGEWIVPVFWLLRALRRVRGSRLDVFGYARHRQQERELIGWYRDLMTSSLDKLTPDTRELVAEIAELPDGIRGYEAIKERNVEAVQQRAAEAVDRLERPHLPVLSAS